MTNKFGQWYCPGCEAERLRVGQAKVIADGCCGEFDDGARNICVKPSGHGGPCFESDLLTYQGPAVDVRPRLGGKTQALLEWLQEQEDPSQVAVVCITKVEAERLKGMWDKRTMGRRPAPRFITYRSPEQLRGIHGPIALDNADLILANLLGRPVDYVTLTGRHA